MSSVPYHKLRVLVADDFSNFRSTVGGMLASLGVVNVDMAATAAEMIEYCESSCYDLILSDYDLGSGRSGQHVLEELRHREVISRNTVFILISAEASRNIVMAAYDCAPDDYLMKPITARMLQQRMDRLLKQRDVMRPVYEALDKHDYERAEEGLIELSLAEDRYSIPAQKLLGELFIKQNQLNKAEKLYTRALEVRALDWARLGLARVKQLRGELDTAQVWLEQIVEEAPLYLPAYDVLAENWQIRGEDQHVQCTVQRAVDISPMSILRQKRLADVAESNNDVSTAVDALRTTIRLGELSCHAKADDHFRFARVISLGLESNIDLDHNVGNEAILALNAAKQRFELDDTQLAQCDLIGSRLHRLGGNTQASEELLHNAMARFPKAGLGLDAELERVATLQSMGKNHEAQKQLNKLQARFAENEQALQKLDIFLDEPVSEANRNLVAGVNRGGIELYEHGKFDEALLCFERARKLFPKHVGIQLNIVQALIGKMRMHSHDRLAMEECFATLSYVEGIIEADDSNYQRFTQLRGMARAVREAE